MMTEAEWLTSTDPERMYEVVAETAFCHKWPHHERTERKRAFFGTACCRLVWPWIVVDERCRRVVEYNECQFDHPAPGHETDEFYLGAKYAAEHPDNETPLLQQLAANLVYDSDDPRSVIGYLVRSFEEWLAPVERARLVADIMRDIVGNPFRPVSFDPSWGTSSVLALAQGIYVDRAFDRLPILADALEDAGCDHPDLLGHLRSGGPHVRGCWAVDLILGKS